MAIISGVGIKEGPPDGISHIEIDQYCAFTFELSLHLTLGSLIIEESFFGNQSNTFR